jgi:hypothetical protein
MDGRFALVDRTFAQAPRSVTAACVLTLAEVADNIARARNPAIAGALSTLADLGDVQVI